MVEMIAIGLLENFDKFAGLRIKILKKANDVI